MDWIRQLPCLVCLTTSDVEAAHVGERAYGRKCPDRQTAPLCAWHHREAKDALDNHLGRHFWDHHQVDRERLLRALNTCYDELRHHPNQCIAMGRLIIQSAKAVPDFSFGS